MARYILFNLAFFLIVLKDSLKKLFVGVEVNEKKLKQILEHLEKKEETKKKEANDYKHLAKDLIEAKNKLSKELRKNK